MTSLDASVNSAADLAGPLVDSFGRVHRSVRISVTDRCNIRCFYCMPAGDVAFAPRSELLTFEEITRLAGVLAAAGVRDVRLTGGEPLMRRDLDRLVTMLSEVPGIEEPALTTNGMLFPAFANRLYRAGLRRVNISLDTLNEETFRRISRREGLDRVLAGIDAAVAAGFRVRLNALAIRGLTEAELEPLVEFAIDRGLTMRFIEYMPLDAGRRWSDDQVLAGSEILARLSRRFGRLVPVESPRPSQPSRDYELVDHPAGDDGLRPRVGVICPVSEPFCGRCDRLRITAEGMLRNCLFSTEEWDLRELLRGGGSDGEILQRIGESVAAKREGHLISRIGFRRPRRAMYRIGG